MNLLNSIEEFYTNLDGTDAYKTLSTRMMHLIEIDNKNITAYFIIYNICHSYVQNYQDQAVSTTFSKYAKSITSSYLEDIFNSFVENNGVVQLSVIDEITRRYNIENKWF